MKIEWIATTEYLPDDRASCWIVQQYGEKRWSIPDAVYIAAERAWYFHDEDIASLGEITHWAPYDEPELPS